MKKYKIAVEQGLSNIEDALREEGYQIIDPDSGSMADAFVITGIDENIMGISDVLTEGVVIDASGRDTEEVLNELERHLHSKEKNEE